ncbi:MAG: hypothetical protein JST91_08585 [Actinobacteria bacterium]|nr:hypothetical protein [Actinomycetota bacterium]
MAKWQVNRDNYSVTTNLGPNREWVAEMQWPEGGTQGGPAVLVIHPSDPDNVPAGGLSHTVLRDVDFKAALDTLRRQLASSKQWGQARANNLQKAAQQLRAASGGGLTDEYLALLSRVYVGAVNGGQAKPLEYLEGVTGKSAAAVKNHLWQATRRGLLERSPGRAGGRITAKAARILAIAMDVHGALGDDFGDFLTGHLDTGNPRGPHSV